MLDAIEAYTSIKLLHDGTTHLRNAFRASALAGLGIAKPRFDEAFAARHG